MRATGLGSAAGSALLLCLLASASPAQDDSRQRAPIIRVYSQDVGVVSSYVTPAIEVSENAYVFAVMMDLDGRIQVLHPEFPGISVRIQSHKRLRLPNFFAGYNAPMEGAWRYTQSGMVRDSYEDLGNDTRGSVIALASRAPFNLELIEANGDWNLSEIRSLIEHRSPAAAAQILARYLGARGEPIGQDYMRFAGQRPSYYAYDDLGYCGYGGYGYGTLGGAFYPAQAFARAAQLRALRVRPVLLGYDACGLPVIGVAPVGSPIVSRFKPRMRPRGDTTVFPKWRLPQAFPRRPGNDEVAPRRAAEGIFPLPQRAEPEMRDAKMAAPQRRRAEPREVPTEFRQQPMSTWVPERVPAPVERPAPARAEPAATGAFPVYRPEPRVIMRAEPAPVPEPRVIIERSPPPAPPPRVQEAPHRAEPPPSPKTTEAAPPPPRR